MRSRMLWSAAWQAAAALGASLGQPRDATAADCTGLASSAVQASLLAGTSRILNATWVPARSLNVSNVFNEAPLCRVAGETRYAGNNSVRFEVWLPDAAAYNGRFMVVGNGGFAGNIETSALMKNVNSGYAVAGGDSGHRASENNDGRGAPGVYLPFLHDRAQVEAWIRNSIAYFTPAAKGVVETFYRKAATNSYYVGCSTGGAQGFALAQYHPELFDGIVAGCPGNWYSHLALSFLWNAQKSQGPSKLPQASLDLITRAVIAQCDGLDGVEDGVVENPLACGYDVSSLACGGPGHSTKNCLTPAQLAAARAIYAGPVDARTNASLYPGFAPGSEVEWTMQQGELSEAFSVPLLQNMVYDDMAYDVAGAFDWAGDVDALDERVGRHIDAISPDLNAFRAAGGKMVVVQSWADAYNAPTWPQQYLQQIEEVTGGDVGAWLRLFMVPGGGHCGAATNYPQVPAEWHMVEALVPWVEDGVAPVAMRTTGPPDGSARSRRLCPWPQTARYRGDGDVDDWRSYECAA